MGLRGLPRNLLSPSLSLAYFFFVASSPLARALCLGPSHRGGAWRIRVHAPHAAWAALQLLK